MAANSVQISGDVQGNGATNLTINQSGGTGFISGAVTNVNNLIFGGSGTFGFDNASALNSFAGGVTVSSGNAISINNMTTNAALTLNGGTLLSAGASQFTGAVTLNASSSVTTSSSGDTLILSGAINGANTLSLGGPGSISLNGIVGGVTPLASLVSTAGNLSLGGTVNTVGDQSYTTGVTLGANTVVSSTGGNIAFQSGIAGGSHTLTLSGGQLSLGGSLTGLSNVSVAGNGVNNSLSVSTSDAQQCGILLTRQTKELLVIWQA